MRLKEINSILINYLPFEVVQIVFGFGGKKGQARVIPGNQVVNEEF